MPALKVMIVDDEPLAIRRLEIALEKIADVTLVGSAQGCDEALGAYLRLKPDILLLDIRMRDGTGFDLLERLPETAVPAVIFVTAFDQFAVRAFEASAADYVLKPVEPARLEEALERARRNLFASGAESKFKELMATIDALRGDIEKQERRIDDDIWAPARGGEYVRVPVADIDYARSEDDYVRIHTAKHSYLLRMSIRKLEAKLTPEEFVRVHRSAIVRIAAIQSVHRKRLGAAEVVLRNGVVLPAGRVYAKRMRDALISAKSPAKIVDKFPSDWAEAAEA